MIRGARVREELDEEMAFHIRCLGEDLLKEGMSPREARREARIRFGSREGVQARTREAQGMALVDETARNLRFAFRGLIRSPVFSSTFILTLALCIGLGAAVFSVVDAVLWRPLPYPAPEQLAQAVLYNVTNGKDPGSTSVDGRTWEKIRDEGRDVERAVYSGWTSGVNLSTDDAAAYVTQQRVGTGYFRILGIPPLMGREFEPAEDVAGGPPVAILSHALWTRTFHQDPEILGTTIRLKGDAFTVVGIMPAEFSSPASADVWTPLRASTSGEGGGANYAVLVRVPHEMSIPEAEARLALIDPPPSTREDAPERRFGLVSLTEAQNAGVQLPLLILLGAIGLMLVVGCANLAGLQIARSLSRQSEMATRQALGSGTGALIRQMVAENLLLGILGGAAGLAVCLFTMEGLQALTQAHFGTWQDVQLDGRVLSAAFGLTILATVLFGFVPVIQVRQPGIMRALLTGSRGVVGKGGHFMRKMLLVGEVTMVTALLFAAGLLVRSYGHLATMEPGFEPEGVLTAQFSLDDARYAQADNIQRLFDESLSNLRAVPGVTSASVALTLPYERPLNLPFRIVGLEDEVDRLTNAVYVTPGFFETLGIPLHQGRVLDDGDRRGAPFVAVANQALVDTYFPGQNAIGNHVQMGFGGGDGVEIIGVVGNVLQEAGWGVDKTPVWETPTLYLAAAQASDGFMRQIHVWFAPSWIIRTAAFQSNLVPEITRAFRAVDPDLPVARMASLDEVMDQAFARERFEAAFLMVVAGFALLLAGIGLYGIVAHEVLERKAEMGLRMALGATPGQAVLKTGFSGIFLTMVGLAFGGGLSVPVGRLMESLLYGVRPFDPVTLGLLVVILGSFSGVASFIPATRIGRTDPAEILREG
jgi:predicted permease